MPRCARLHIPAELGSYHITSRVVGREFLFQEAEKEKYLSLLESFSQGFFLDLHAFCIMDNHIHLLVSSLEEEAENASVDELIKRYRLIYGETANPPIGSLDFSGTEIPDDDGGVQRLRERLGSVSRFMQEIQQRFSRWYNKRNNRVGHLWESRFHSTLFSRGESELVGASYIDLNPIRAGIVKRPEDYRWSSIGLQARDPSRFNRFVTPINTLQEKGENCWDWYRIFLYFAGSIKKTNAASIDPVMADEVRELHGRLNLSDKLRFRIKNLSEGIGIGAQDFIESLQSRLNHKLIQAREYIGLALYTTRYLRT